MAPRSFLACARGAAWRGAPCTAQGGSCPPPWLLQVSTRLLHPSGEDEDVEAAFPNELSLQQVCVAGPHPQQPPLHTLGSALLGVSPGCLPQEQGEACIPGPQSVPPRPASS